MVLCSPSYTHLSSIFMGSERRFKKYTRTLNRKYECGFKKVNANTFVLSQVCYSNTEEFSTIWDDELHNIKSNCKDNRYIKYQSTFTTARLDFKDTE